MTIKSSNQEIILKILEKKKTWVSTWKLFWAIFSQNEDKSKDSFGLGLYIVHNILKANGYTLQYEFKDEINRFICKRIDYLRYSDNWSRC